MAARSVLHELDELRSMLDQPYGSSQGLGRSVYSSPERPQPIKAYGTAINSAEKNVNRLGRAIEAAEEEMDAALQRTTEVHRTQLRQRELEVAELQRVAATKERAIDGLRETLSAAKRTYEARLAQASSALASRETEVSALSAEVLALRTERDDLEARLARGTSAAGRLEVELTERTEHLSRSLRAKTEEAGAAAAAAHRERQDKEVLRLEVGELKKELDALEEELRVTREEAAHYEQQAHDESEARRDLEVQVDKLHAQLQLVKESKELEIEELKRRLRAERGVRKACERWLKAELKSREEMEAMLVAVRDIATGKTRGAPSSSAPVETQMAQVEALLDNMKGGGVDRARGANSPAREFTAMKRALEEDSSRLKQEIAQARRMLSDKLRN